MTTDVIKNIRRTANQFKMTQVSIQDYKTTVKQFQIYSNLFKNEISIK